MTLQTDFPLTTLNTLQLPALAAHYLYVDDCALLPKLPPHQRRFILGGGSNLVLLGDFDGLVLHVGFKGKRLAFEDADAWYVEAAGGENWHDFVLWALAQGWPGLENLVLIPGTVGAAPVQNIGAYGLEAGERIHQVRAIDLETGSEKIFSPTDCRFGYRQSLWKQEGWHLSGRSLITAVTFRLPKQWQANCRYADLAAELEKRGISQPTPQQIADAIITLRQRKLPDPAILPNAGSFFENPIVDALTAEKLAAAHPGLPCYRQADGKVKLAAGWLIEQVGWKGRQLGKMGIYEKQALILVNYGNGKSQDICALVTAVQSDVRRQFGVDLRPEPVFIGSVTN
ncbi:MAG: murB [Proteobacteria bacterium]|nr:murB [Pseudomonadota bacterium]